MGFYYADICRLHGVGLHTCRAWGGDPPPHAAMRDSHGTACRHIVILATVARLHATPQAMPVHLPTCLHNAPKTATTEPYATFDQLQAVAYGPCRAASVALEASAHVT